jgi:hypothetical protein
VAPKPLTRLTVNCEALESGDRGFPRLMENAALYLMNGHRGAALDAGVRAGWKGAL